MVFAALLVLAVMYSSAIFKGIGLAVSIATPFICGGAIAFVLNLPMKAIEEKLLAKWKGRVANKLKRPVSMLLAIIVLLLIITFVIITVVPQITTAAAVLGQKVPAFIDKVVVELQQLSEDYPQLEEQVAALSQIELNWDSIVDTAINFLKNGVSSMLTSTFSVASGIIGGVVNVVIAFIFAIYILSQKEKLADQGRRILTAYLPEKWSQRMLKVFALVYRNFSNFITGQCLEAVILGSMFIIAMTIFRMPYAFMVGVLIAFTALIPVVGAFIGCVVGAFLILIENPMLALWFVVLFLILQQVEGNLIYPKVVGNSVGLPAIWVLMAVSLGGSLFGVIGMLIFIPLLSTFYSLLRENVNARNAGKSAVRNGANQKVGNTKRGTVEASRRIASEGNAGNVLEESLRAGEMSAEEGTMEDNESSQSRNRSNTSKKRKNRRR